MSVENDTVEQELREQLAAVEEALQELPGDAELQQAKVQLLQALEETHSMPDEVAHEGPAAPPLPPPRPHPARPDARGTNNERIHPRNRYATQRPDFVALAKEYPSLEPYLLFKDASKTRASLDFRDPEACRALTAALLARDYGIQFRVPPGHLVPPLTGRSNYIHWLEDLLELLPRAPDSRVRGLDIGTGANLIYPLLGVAICGWSMVGVDVGAVALESAAKLRDANPHLAGLIELRAARMQPEQAAMFRSQTRGTSPERSKGAGEDVGPEATALKRDFQPELAPALDEAPADGRAGRGIVSGALLEHEPPFAFSMCNPPFFASAEEAGQNPATAFGGTDLEMVYPGGEEAFVLAMARDSAAVSDRVFWFTTMVGKKSTLRILRAALRALGVRSVRDIEFAQGRTSRWGFAWTWRTDLKGRDSGRRTSVAGGAVRRGQRRSTAQLKSTAAEAMRLLCEAARAVVSDPSRIELDEHAYSVTIRLNAGTPVPSSPAPPLRKKPRTDNQIPMAHFQIFQDSSRQQTIVATLGGGAALHDDSLAAFADIVRSVFGALPHAN